ncbi:MAG: glycosyltransferase [Lachnospiraceae bacterium]|nr:glycosyltransferase [Lachnospiraceae bacterium]
MKVAVVLVTYNRIECLKIALSKYENQKKIPSIIIVVDNASNDGTYEYLEGWKTHDAGIEKVVVHNEKNIGGSGGFYTGLKKSLDYEYEYAFLADDDAYPESDMFEKLLDNKRIAEAESTAALCTSVINHEKLDISHRCRIKKGVINIGLKWVPEEEYNKQFFKLDIVTFVGAAIKRSVIDKIGLPIKEYFIYYDDTEYFMRVRKYGNVYCLPQSRMIHNTDAKQSIDSWKGYYDTRNWIDTIKRHYGKRYLSYVIITSYLRRCTFLATLFRKRSKQFMNMCKIAIKDGMNGVLGISDIYYPGAKL